MRIHDIKQVPQGALDYLLEAWSELPTEMRSVLQDKTRLHTAITNLMAYALVKTRAEIDREIGEFLRGNGQFTEGRETRTHIIFDEKI